MRKAFAIWLMAGLPLLADSVAATRSWVSNRVAEARAEWRGDVASATNPVPSWISAAEGRVDGRLGAATNAVKGWIEASTNGLPEMVAAATNGLPAKIAAVTNGLPAKIAAVTNGLPAKIAAVTNGLPEAIAGATNGLPEKIAAVTNGLPERMAALTNGLPEAIVAATNGVMDGVNAATGSLWTAIGNIEGVTADIGALARTNDLPTKVSQLENDAGYLTNHVDVSNLARAAGVFPDWTSKGTWSEGEFCTWKGVVYRFTGAGDPSAQPDISPVSWAVSDVGTAIAEARPDMSSLTNPIPAWIAASTNGLPEAIAAATNGLPAQIAGVTNGLPERIASVTNGLPERMVALTNGLPEAIAAATNGLPEAIVASTNPIPSWIAAATGGVPARVSALVQSMVSGLDGKAATRLVSADGYRWIDGTGAVWQVAQRATWNGSQADAPLGETSFAGDGWELVWTDDGTGVTGSWDLYRTLSPNGPLVAHFTVSDLPYREGMPVSLSLVECTVGGVEASVGQKTDHGWYQIGDSVGSLHFVSPLVTTATVARVTNHVDRLALSGELVTSDDVAAIVTNETEAVYGQTWSSNMEDRFPGSHVYWLEWPDYEPYGGFWTTTDSSLVGADLDGDLYATMIVVPQWEGPDSPDLVFTRDYTPPRNALGLARLSDLETVSGFMSSNLMAEVSSATSAIATANSKIYARMDGVSNGRRFKESFEKQYNKYRGSGLRYVDEYYFGGRFGMDYGTSRQDEESRFVLWTTGLWDDDYDTNEYFAVCSLLPVSMRDDSRTGVDPYVHSPGFLLPGDYGQIPWFSLIRAVDAYGRVGPVFSQSQNYILHGWTAAEDAELRQHHPNVAYVNSAVDWVTNFVSKHATAHAAVSASNLLDRAGAPVKAEDIEGRAAQLTATSTVPVYTYSAWATDWPSDDEAQPSQPVWTNGTWAVWVKDPYMTDGPFTVAGSESDTNLLYTLYGYVTRFWRTASVAGDLNAYGLARLSDLPNLSDVTNEVYTFTPWVTSPITEYDGSPIVVVWDGEGWVPHNGSGLNGRAVGDIDSTELEWPSDSWGSGNGGSLYATRQRIGMNALGLARLSEVTNEINALEHAQSSRLSQSSQSSTNYTDAATNALAQSCAAAFMPQANAYTKSETDAKIVELAPPPGDYATVSNKAMTALQAHQSLAPSTNYTDSAIGSFAATGTVKYANGADIAGEANRLWDRFGIHKYDASQILEMIVSSTNGLARASDIPTNHVTKTDFEKANGAKQDKLPYQTNAIPYSAISGKPTLAAVATSGSYGDLSGRPALSTVATSGSYNDLANRPSIPSTAADVGAATPQGVSNIVTVTYIREKLGVYLYIGQDGGIYVHTGD